MSKLHVAFGQLTSGESVSTNVDRILDLMKKLPMDFPVDLVCLPENSLFFNISKKRPAVTIRLDDPELKRLQDFVDHRDCGLLLGSIPLPENQGVFNATLFLQPQAPVSVVYRKIHLFDVDVPGAPPVRESDAFHYGPRPEVLEWRDWRIGLSICYDIRYPELYLQYAKQGVDLIMVPSAFLVPTGQAHWEVLLRARAIESQCYVVAAAQSGEHRSEAGDKRYTYGHSLAIGPWGEKIAELSDDQRLGCVTLDKEAIHKVRSQIPMENHRRQRVWEGI